MSESGQIEDVEFCDCTNEELEAGRSCSQPTCPNRMTAEFIAVTDVKVGDKLVGGVVTGIRVSKSGKSIWFTMRGARGEVEWPPQSTATRTAVFTGSAR